MTLTKKEEKIIKDSITAIGDILFNKMDKGIPEPTINGKMNVINENRELIFTVTARDKK